MKKFTNPSGFTLIEILIVIVIIGILSTFAFTNYLNVRMRARDTQRKSDIRQMQAAFELYRADQGTYPASPLPACGSSLTSGGTGGTIYMQKVPCDPPTNTTPYRYTTTGTTYTLFACLENVNDSQKDLPNNNPSNPPPQYTCDGTKNWSFTVTNP